MSVPISGSGHRAGHAPRPRSRRQWRRRVWGEDRAEHGGDHVGVCVLGTYANKLRAKWSQRRLWAAPWNDRLSAAMRPACWSELTSARVGERDVQGEPCRSWPDPLNRSQRPGKGSATDRARAVKRSSRTRTTATGVWIRTRARRVSLVIRSSPSI